MKKGIKILITLVCVAILAVVIVKIETNDKSPKDRYQEASISTTTSEIHLDVTMNEEIESNRVIFDNYHCFQYEFISYEIIDDENIASQDKYIGHYFGSEYGRYFGEDEECPNPNYVKGYTNYDAMRNDFPEYEEYLNSFGEKGMTEEEYTKFLDDHLDDYTEYKHPKTKYIFLKCKITRIDTGDFDNDPFSDMRILALRDNNYIGDYDGICFFDKYDKTQKADAYEYLFPKEGDSIECVFGFELTEEHFDFSEENDYFVGFVPPIVEDVEDYNPSTSKSFVNVFDLLETK